MVISFMVCATFAAVCVAAGLFWWAGRYVTVTLPLQCRRLFWWTDRYATVTSIARALASAPAAVLLAYVTIAVALPSHTVSICRLPLHDVTLLFPGGRHGRRACCSTSTSQCAATRRVWPICVRPTRSTSSCSSRPRRWRRWWSCARRPSPFCSRLATRGAVPCVDGAVTPALTNHDES